MREVDKIILEFKKKSLRDYGVIVLSKQDALVLIDKCCKENIGILGIDAFKIYKDGSIQPFMEYSVDYSSMNPDMKPRESCVRAKNFLEDFKQEGFSFEVVVDKS